MSGCYCVVSLYRSAAVLIQSLATMLRYDAGCTSGFRVSSVRKSCMVYEPLDDGKFWAGCLCGKWAGQCSECVW